MVRYFNISCLDLDRCVYFGRLSDTTKFDMWPLFLSLIFLSSPISISGHNNCPVTSRFNISENGYLPFPSLYWTHKLQPDPGEEFYKCSVLTVYGKPDVIGACMPRRHCLVTREMLMAAAEPQKWEPSMNAICSLEEQIHRNADNKHSPRYSLNLIIIGGSMTRGSETYGKCVCTQSEDSRCAKINRSRFPETFCSWVAHFVNWIAAEFPMIQFNVSDLSRGGMNSGSVAGIVDPSLRELTLSDNDIIIIDESVNDALRGPIPGVQKAVESMIRRLFISAKGSYPTMIMVEQFPHRGQREADNTTEFVNRVLPGDYAIVYRNLSEHYHFPLYSMREVYWTYFNKNISKSHRYPISPYDSWHIYAHPPWYFHNFMADVIADCFLHSLSKCRHMRESGANRIHPRYILPPPYYPISTSDYCDALEPYLLNTHASNYFRPKNLTQFEQGDEAKQVGWREYVDYHNTPGWMINDLSVPSQRDLSFPIPTEFPKAGSWRGLIVVTHLKSYEGMGAAKLFVCGIETSLMLDGLLGDFRSNKVSVPHLASIKINAHEAAMCNKLPVEERTLMIRYQPDYQTPSLPGSDKVRRHQKMKIYSIQICTKASH
jgi:hypothetical protein